MIWLVTAFMMAFAECPLFSEKTQTVLWVLAMFVFGIGIIVYLTLWIKGAVN